MNNSAVFDDFEKYICGRRSNLSKAVLQFHCEIQIREKQNIS